MIEAHYSTLDEVEKLQYFEAATNPILQKLISSELTTVEEQLLNLEKRNEESDTSFRRRFDVLQINRKLLLSFLDINAQVVKQIQNLQNN